VVTPILARVKRASIVYNPKARNAPSHQRLLDAAAVQAMRGWEVTVAATEAPMHAVELAREAVLAGSEVVLACGGDGTLNEVINGIVGSDVTLGVLRAGTGNVFGKEVHVPRPIEDALAVLSRGQVYRFDLGYAEGEGVVGGSPGDGGPRRHFLCMAGIGFDGAVVRDVPATPKRLLGTTSYVIWGAAEALRFKGRPVEVTIDGDAAHVDLYWALLGNTRSYGGVANVALEAVADDGALDVYLFSGKGMTSIVRLGALIALRRHQRASGVAYRKGREVEIRSPGLQVQADGEYFGETPMGFGVVQRAIKVLLMPGAADRILRNQ
jgi:YegS/Rv2252/BmrU family lipid kinase